MSNSARDEFQMCLAALRVASRAGPRFSKVFNSPEQLKKYLHEHPNADRSLHSVEKHEQKHKDDQEGNERHKDDQEGNERHKIDRIDRKNPDEAAPDEKKEKTPKKKKLESDSPKETIVSDSPVYAQLKVTSKDIAKMAKKFSKDFDRIANDGRERIAIYKQIDRDPPGTPHFKSLSEPEQINLVTCHLAGKEFLKSLSPEETKLHDKLHENWIRSSQADTSQELHGMLAEMGVKGYQSPDEKDDDKVKALRQKGATDRALADYTKKAYAFQQAFYRHLGMKTMTLFRGVRDDATKNAETGTPTQVQTREAASFSSSPDLSMAFGRVVEYKVPVANMLFSGAAAPRYQGERETIVLGGTELVGHVQEKFVPKENNDE